MLPEARDVGQMWRQKPAPAAGTPVGGGRARDAAGERSGPTGRSRCAGAAASQIPRRVRTWGTCPQPVTSYYTEKEGHQGWGAWKYPGNLEWAVSKRDFVPSGYYGMSSIAKFADTFAHSAHATRRGALDGGIPRPRAARRVQQTEATT